VSDNFNDLPWHDAVLLNLSIDRHRAGERDEVLIQVSWPQGDEATLLFSDCYGFTADMNFGVIGEEHILIGDVVDDDPGLVSLRERWKQMGVPLETLRCYRIETNSTASVLKIYAQHFEVMR
jgi:hypothetical protein